MFIRATAPLDNVTRHLLRHGTIVVFTTKENYYSGARLNSLSLSLACFDNFTVHTTILFIFPTAVALYFLSRSEIF